MTEYPFQFLHSEITTQKENRCTIWRFRPRQTCAMDNIFLNLKHNLDTRKRELHRVEFKILRNIAFSFSTFSLSGFLFYNWHKFSFPNSPTTVYHLPSSHCLKSPKPFPNWPSLCLKFSDHQKFSGLKHNLFYYISRFSVLVRTWLGDFSMHLIWGFLWGCSQMAIGLQIGGLVAPP